jgi:hypothetical protein
MKKTLIALAAAALLFAPSLSQARDTQNNGSNPTMSNRGAATSQGMRNQRSARDFDRNRDFGRRNGMNRDSDRRHTMGRDHDRRHFGSDRGRHPGSQTARNRNIRAQPQQGNSGY